MHAQAQNCLLKTLEEAQAGTYFLLTADIETALLPTIRSRCRVIRVQPWPRERIEAWLLRRGVPAARARALSLYCEGSPGRALQMQQDDGYWVARDTARRSFFSVESAGDLPAAARLLKDQKDAGDQLLDIVEQELRSLLHEKLLGRDEGGSEELSSRWHAAPPASLRALLEAVWTARRQKNANVGWAALSEGLLQTISEPRPRRRARPRGRAHPA